MVRSGLLLGGSRGSSSRVMSGVSMVIDSVRVLRTLLINYLYVPVSRV